MAELTIHGWDNKFDPSGAARILRDECKMQIKDAKEILDFCQRGGRRTVDVPFSRLASVRKSLEAKGFRTS